MNKRDYRRYRALADYICGEGLYQNPATGFSRVHAENASAYAWQLYHPWRYRVGRFWSELRDVPPRLHRR